MMQVDSPDEHMTEKVRELLEASVNCGRRLRSPQTGFVHYAYRTQDNEVQQTIPVLENALFCLALLRTRLMENIAEAKNILERLPHFQCTLPNDSKGNFPVYLHEYPECRDHFSGIVLLAPFYWILKHYGRVLGNELKVALEHSVKEIFIYADRLESRRELPYSITARLAAGRWAFGKLWLDPVLSERGEQKLNELLHSHEANELYSTEYLADLLVSLQMVYPSVKESPWNEFWNWLNTSWHQPSCTYVGPSVREEQKRGEPQVGLYDYFLGCYARCQASRIKLPDAALLKASLLNPSKDRLDPVTSIIKSSGLYRGNHWNLIQTPKWACTLIEKQEPINPCKLKTYTPFRLVWGGPSQTHSLVCQSLDLNKITFENHSTAFNLFFHLEANADLEDREKQREVNFYLDFHPAHQIRVNGLRSSTFELGQILTIQSATETFSLEFELVEGNGQFLGHVMRSNRPSQIEAKGENRFNSYDWHLFLRTIRRGESCMIKVKITCVSGT
jgi:hypothetical protein